MKKRIGKKRKKEKWKEKREKLAQKQGKSLKVASF